MTIYIRRIVKRVFSLFGLSLVREATLYRLERASHAENDVDLLLSLIDDYGASSIREYQRLYSLSTSQLKQDLFVLAHLDFKNHGYFVEFGATNGVKNSNSLVLEKYFQWGGILAEPCKSWHKVLKESRACNIETSCVWSITGASLPFSEYGMQYSRNAGIIV